jgi:hypothetical protein
MIALVVGTAWATVVGRHLDPHALAVLSDAALLGDVEEVSTRWSAGRIWTVATLYLPEERAEAEVWIPGGCVGSVCLTVSGSPWVEEGETVFVFLRDGAPTSLSQGLFHVQGDEAERDPGDLAFLHDDGTADRFKLAALVEAAEPLRVRR